MVLLKRVFVRKIGKNMILIGDKLIPFENIYRVFKVEDIQNTPSNSTILFDFEEEKLTFSYKNKINSAVVITSIKEAIYCNSLGVRYIICQKELAIRVQKIAENYMFDSKILAIIESSDEIESIALNEIDGIIYKDLL